MLQHWYESPTRSADTAACRALLRNGSKTFHAASFLLPRRVREPASALYAFCRLADDCIDVEGGAISSVRQLRGRLERAYLGRPDDHPADRAFATTVHEYGIPSALPDALLSGLEWDALGRRYETIAELESYAARVAGSVGAMMAALMGATTTEAVARACDLGCAMQLTNIARDVGEDARNGRLYLPQSWMREAGIEPDLWLASPSFSLGLASVIDRLLARADRLYARAEAGIDMLPPTCRPGIRAAHSMYREIGHTLRRDGLDSVSRRTVVPLSRKLQLLGHAMAPWTGRDEARSEPCLPESQFLVDALVGRAGPTLRISLTPWWHLQSRAIWVLDLFEQLERRQRSTRRVQATPPAATTQRAFG